MRLSDALEGYWLTRRMDLSPHTQRDYELSFRRLVEFSKDADIEAIDANAVRRFLAHLPSAYGLGDRTLSNVWTALSSLWTWAELELSVPHALRGKVKRPKFIDMIPDAFTHDELRALVKAAKFTRTWQGRAGGRAQSRRPTASRDEAIILVLVDTGIRASELCDLTVGDYDRGRGRLHIRHGKNNKARYVAIGTRAAKALWLYMTKRDGVKAGDPLFAAKSGRFMQRDNLRHMLDTIGKNAEVEHVYPHRFRHTFAIQFLRNGGNIALLKELMGHESIEMVMRYAKIVEQDVGVAATHSPADNWRL
jgi:integrase/recombinase XerD